MVWIYKEKNENAKSMGTFSGWKGKKSTAHCDTDCGWRENLKIIQRKKKISQCDTWSHKAID